MTKKLNDFEKKLITDHIVLAQAVASQKYRTAPHALDLDDLRSLAYQGLVDAASRWFSYCESKGYNPEDTQFFVIYARPRIAGSIYDKLRSDDWATRALRDKAKKLREAGADEGISREELSARSGMSQQEIHEVVAGMSRAPVSLNSIDMDDQDPERKVAYHSELSSPADTEHDVSVGELLNSFADAILGLPKSHQALIALHYYQGLELKKISKLLDIPDAMTSQIHTESVLALLESLKQTALMGM
jgi:RNA polymerase sigma factor for flagellar operon FliA